MIPTRLPLWAFRSRRNARRRKSLPAKRIHVKSTRSAVRDPLKGRIQIHLISLKWRSVELLAERFHFRVPFLDA